MKWSEWREKRIFVKLNDGSVYNGVILDTDEEFITIRDKFGEKVYFKICNISKIKEEGLKNGK